MAIEMASAVASYIRGMGAVDMAIGNLLDSNLFNIAIMAIDDLVYKPGPLLANVWVLWRISHHGEQ